MVRVRYTEMPPVAASGNNTLTLPNDGTIISKDSNGVVGVTSVERSYDKTCHLSHYMVLE